MKLSKIYSQNRLLILLISILVILIGLPVIILLMLNKSMTAVAWYDTAWGHRKSVTVSNSTGSTLTNEDVLVSLDTVAMISEGKLQVDCDDLRFLDSDDSTILNYWIEGGCNTNTTQVWVQIPNLPSTGKKIYVYYDNPSVANGETIWTNNFIALSDQSDCATGWTRYSDMDDRFPRGAPTAGATGGSTTHIHTVSGSAELTSAPIRVPIGYLPGYGDLVGADNHRTHTHSTSWFVESATSIPSCVNMLFCKRSKLDIPQHHITVLDTDSVSGWTRYSNLDDRYPRGASSSIGTTCGSSSHNHSVTSSLDQVNLTSSEWLYGIDVTIIGNPHSHSASSSLSSYTNHRPDFSRRVVFMKKDNPGVLNSERPIYMFDSSTLPPYGWSNSSDFTGVFIFGGTTYQSGTVLEETHSHSGSMTSGPAQPSYNIAGYSPNEQDAVASHTHEISYTLNDQVSNPPYLNVVFAKRKLSQATSIGEEDSPVPNTPTIQPATALSTTGINWNFTDNSTDELGFKVYDESNILKVTCDTPDISSCLETGLSENTQYTRKIVAYNTLGESEYSDTVSAYTKAGNIDITDIQSTVDAVNITSSTFANPTVGESGYYFDCTSGSCNTGINEWIQTQTDTVTPLENNTGYKFRVKSRNGDGVETNYSNTQEVWTKAQVPTISTSDITNTTITLEGTGVNNIAQSSSGYYFDCISQNCNTGINEWVSVNTDTVIGLLPDTQYEFQIKARNYDGIESAYSTSITPHTKSTQPTILSLNNQTVNTLNIAINNNENPSTTLYLLEEVNRAKYINSTGVLVVDPVWLTYQELGSQTGITVTGLESNTEYTFRVKAKNQVEQETPYSTPVSAHTQLKAPTALSPLTKTDSSITWRISTTENGYDGIRIYDSSDNLITTCIGADITQCQEIGLNPNTEYSRRVTIYSTHSESAFTSLISERTYAQAVSISLISALSYYESSLTINLGNNPVGTKVQIFEESTSKYLDENLGVLVEGERSITSTGDPITVSGLSPNAEYIFKVRALDDSNNPTAWSTTSSVRTHVQVPNIVSTVALSTTSGRVTIDLKDNPEGTRVSILEQSGQYVTESGVFDDTEDIFILSSGSIDITSLEANTVYTLKVRAFNEDTVESDWSSTLQLTTLIEQPTVEISQQTSDSVTLAISGISNVAQGDAGIYVEDMDQWSKELTQTVTRLKPNSKYTFNVKVRNSEGIENSYVESDSVYTLAQTPLISDSNPNSTTTGVLSLDLRDNPNGTRVIIKETGSNKYLNSQGNLVAEEIILPTEQLNFGIKGLLANSTYNFKVKAYNEQDIPTAYSTEGINLTTLIEDPTLSLSNPTTSSVDITVSGVSNIDAGDSRIFVERLNSWNRSLTQTVTGLNPNTSYTFKVKARNREGVTTPYVSSPAVQTLASIPSVPSVRKLSANSARIYLDISNNPSYTQVAIRDSVSGQYVNANGRLQTEPVWQTYAQWGGGLGQYVTGIEGLRQVGFEVKARNRNSVETAFGDRQYIGTGSVLQNVPLTISANLKDNGKTDLSSEAQLGIKDVQLKKDQYMVADVKVSFEENRDWSDVVADADVNNSKAVIKVSGKHGISDPFTMYVVRNDTNAFRICPDAQSLLEVKKGCEGEQLLTKKYPQEVTIEEVVVTVSEAKIDGVYYWIADGLTGTGGMGERVETSEGKDKIVVDENPVAEPEKKDSVISNLQKRISNRVNQISKDLILGTTELLDKTALGQLNEDQLSTALATTTTVTITIGVASTGFMQSVYLIFHFVNGLFNAFGFRRKKKPFGFVYDSTSKEPLSNAVVRIYENGQLIDTTVTDARGVFLSSLKKGEYTIEVKKGGYEFPSKLIKGKDDYPLTSIYKGEVIKNAESADLIVNIPLDRKELSSTNRLFIQLKSIFTVFLTLFNILLFMLGILLLIYTYYKSPDTFKWYMLLLYIPALYFLTKSLFTKDSVYGKVVDKKRKPVLGKELFLIDKEFNEVVAKRVTDQSGRYRFICNKGRYELRMDNKILADDINIKRDGYILAKKFILN